MITCSLFTKIVQQAAFWRLFFYIDITFVKVANLQEFNPVAFR